MTGAAIVRWKAGEAIVLAVHGAFDGASAWALRVGMEESSSRDFVIDLTHAEEACEFAASLLAAFSQRWRREKRVRFRPGTPEHARLLAGYGLDVLDDDVDVQPDSRLPGAVPLGRARTGRVRLER